MDGVSKAESPNSGPDNKHFTLCYSPFLSVPICVSIPQILFHIKVSLPF